MIVVPKKSRYKYPDVTDAAVHRHQRNVGEGHSKVEHPKSDT